MLKNKLFYERIKNTSLKKNLIETIRDVWTFTSTSIEGNTLTLGDTTFVLNEGLTISGKSIREHNEVIGHSTAIDILYEFISKSTNSVDLLITDEKLFEFHTAIMLNPVLDIYAPVGKFKVGSNYTRKIDKISNNIQYIEYPTPEKIPFLMSKWYNKFFEVKDSEILAQYCELHILFTAIHPFADGNGRISRLLANIPIIRAGLVPITISKESKKRICRIIARYRS